MASCGQAPGDANLQPISKINRQSAFTVGVNSVLYDADDVAAIQTLGEPGQVPARITCYWNDIEPTADNWQFTIYDDLVKRANEARIPLLGIVGYSMRRLAASQSSLPGQPWDLSFYPPDDPQAFANYAGTLAARYPQIGAWEIWNEPNTTAFWRPAPDAARYAQMLKLSYAAIKAVNPQATVVLGGLAPGMGKGQVDTVYATDFLAALYQNGAKDSFDAVGYHPYDDGAEPDSFLDDYLTSLYSVMVRYGDGNKKMWVTEIGWFTGTAANAVSEATQADYLTRAFTLLYNREFVDHVYWYNLKDYTSLSQPNNPAVNYGLFRWDGSRRPAADSFRNFH